MCVCVCVDIQLQLLQKCNLLHIKSDGPEHLVPHVGMVVPPPSFTILQRVTLKRKDRTTMCLNHTF